MIAEDGRRRIGQGCGQYEDTSSAAHTGGILLFGDALQKSIHFFGSEAVKRAAVTLLHLIQKSVIERSLVAECGASQIMMGTDFPYPWTSTAVEHILGTASLSDTERAAILGDTACKLLHIAP